MSERESLARLEKLFQEYIARNETQKRAFDTLYQEMDGYRRDFILESEKPLLLDLLLFYDSMAWFQQTLAKEEVSREVIAESFQYLVDEFLEVLYRRDVVPVETAERFDAATQKAVKVIHTERPERGGAVEQVLKRGFKRGERLLRPEEVVVARHGKSR